YIGLGIAGNFALHLDQAGEAEDFKDIITADEAAPKGMFPFYLPKPVEAAKDILNTYPLDADYIKLPEQDVNVQAEPEVGLVCELEYTGERLIAIKPTHFGAYNDCSIRVKGASKISDKKNWGKSSKGLSNTLFEIDAFAEGGVMDKFSIASFLRRGNEVHAYGEDVELNGYNYFYSKLTDWMVKQIDTQNDFGPLEDLISYISECDQPSKAIISIGATRYTKYGETTFLKSGDEVIIVVYDNTKHSASEISKRVIDSVYTDDTMSVLKQKVL
ncbi:MAG: DUF5718 family protein, partial [Thiovulaceae bacterium]|nr:DUF5718 family protein [Sulfurimonadaceae bacterium]